MYFKFKNFIFFNLKFQLSSQIAPLNWDYEKFRVATVIFLSLVYINIFLKVWLQVKQFINNSLVFRYTNSSRGRLAHKKIVYIMWVLSSPSRVIRVCVNYVSECVWEYNIYHVKH
jgi:hypothetical protein